MFLILIVIAVFATVTCATIAVLRKPNTVSIESRMQDFRARTAVGLEDEIDLEAPFVERVLKPGVEGIARAAGSILPKSVLAEIQRQLIMAGNPMKQSTFVTFWMGCLLTFFAIWARMDSRIGRIPMGVLTNPSEPLTTLTSCPIGDVIS